MSSNKPLSFKIYDKDVWVDIASNIHHTYNAAKGCWEDGQIGADIHIYSESLINNKWKCNETFVEEVEEDYIHFEVPYQEAFFTGRNYLLFGIIAGVRAREYQMLEPKGMPDNVSEDIKRCYKAWETDAHTPSYLDLKELEQLDDDMDLPVFLSSMDDEEYVIHTAKIIKNWILELKKFEGEDHRVVFWFDN